MKSVMLSIRPKWCELIATGEKTVEVRKTKPNIDTPFKVYIYETMTAYNSVSRQNDGLRPHLVPGKVIGEFVCDYICGHLGKFGEETFKLFKDVKQSCLSVDEWNDYSKNGLVYCWHISNLVIYDKPKALRDFITCKWLCDECDITDIRESNSRYRHCIVDCGAKCVTRPPQSWCYVEEIE